MENTRTSALYIAFIALVLFTSVPISAGFNGILPSSARIISPLSYRVLDAEYSKSLDRIISVSESPNRLHIYDPETEQEVALNLPKVPNCVSVSPDGYYAVVGHDAWISYIDLRTASLISVLPVTTDVLDIVLAGNGFAYAFPRQNQWSQIHCVELQSGVETTHTGSSIYAGTVGKLHPDGKAIYGANNGLSPSDIEKYSIEQGTAQYLYDSPYHGTYAMCGDLWMSEDGLRIFTKCGNVFRASETRSEDMTYNGSLSQTLWIQSVAHSAGAHKVLAIPAIPYYQPTNEDTEVHVYGYDYLSFETSISLPSFTVNGASYAGHGKFVFFNNAGTRYYVILKADDSSGMLYDYGIATFSSGSTTPQGQTETLYFAQFANGDGFISELTLTNPSATETATGDIVFFDDAGNPLSFSLNGQSQAVTTSVSIAPLGSITLSTDGIGTLVVGSARVYGSVPLGGVIRFKYPILGIAGVGSTVLTTGFISPVTRSIQLGRSTGIAVTTSSSGTSLILTLRNKDGALIPGGTETTDLPANGHLARFIEQLFPAANISEFEGTLTVTSSNTVFITGSLFEVGSNPGEFTTMPVTPLH